MNWMPILVGFYVIFNAVGCAFYIHGWLDRNPDFRFRQQGRALAGLVASSSLLIFSYLIVTSLDLEHNRVRAERWRQIALKE